MKEYKIGDKVRILSKEALLKKIGSLSNMPYGWNLKMDKYLGKVWEVTRVGSGYVKIDKAWYTWANLAIDTSYDENTNSKVHSLIKERMV